jgi:hypothetical protein
MSPADIVLTVLLVAHFGGLILICWRDPSNLGGRR